MVDLVIDWLFNVDSDFSLSFVHHIQELLRGRGGEIQLDLVESRGMEMEYLPVFRLRILASIRLVSTHG